MNKRTLQKNKQTIIKLKNSKLDGITNGLVKHKRNTIIENTTAVIKNILGNPRKVKIHQITSPLYFFFKHSNAITSKTAKQPNYSPLVGKPLDIIDQQLMLFLS